jgi:hypothetical protein
MHGFAITAACSLFSPCGPGEFGPIGGIGIHIMSGADHAAISSATVVNFTYGIVAEANYTSVAGANLNAMVGVSLNNVDNSNFTDISYTPADERYHAQDGPVLSVSGGGHNTFTFAAATTFLSGVVFGRPGVLIANSSYNVIQGADLSCSAQAQAGPGILLTQDSNHNSIIGNNILVLFGNGIKVDTGSDYNIIQSNAVVIASPPGYFAMFDQNPNCGHDVWTGNSFTNANPASCIN